MCSRVGALQKIDFFLKIADFSVIVNIFVKMKFDVMQMLLWPIKLDENKVLIKIFRYIKNLNMEMCINFEEFTEIV